MKYLITLIALGAASLSFSVQAAEPACDAQATEKKLAGAAKTSFMKKCAADANAMTASGACETQAIDKKLAGAAKTSFMKKCAADAKKV